MQIQTNRQKYIILNNKYERRTKCLYKMIKLSDYTVKQQDCHTLMLVCNYIYGFEKKDNNVKLREGNNAGDRHHNTQKLSESDDGLKIKNKMLYILALY